MAIGFGLVVQRLPRRRDRVLAVGNLVGVRAGDGWFSPGDIAKMFELLRLPSPGNISQELARLRDVELVLRRGSGSWSLTPEGNEAMFRLVGDVDAAAIAAEIRAGGSAEFAGGEHPLIPPGLAPLPFLPAVRRLLDISPFERNVFCMTRFPKDGDAEDDPIADAVATLRRALADQGLVMHLASDRNADDQLFGNVAAHIWGCKYGIALLETRAADQDADAKQLSDNVLVEIGAMLVTGRRCALLKDRLAPMLPTDFVAHLFKEVDIADQRTLADVATAWVTEDLRAAGR
jgi:SAM-dependent methyltransferase